MPRKLATTIYITVKQQERLKELNEHSKIPIAEFIRQGIDMILDRYEKSMPGQLPLPLKEKE